MTESREKAVELLAGYYEHRDISKCGVYNVFVKDAESGQKSRKQYYASSEIEAVNLLLLETAMLDSFYQIERIEKV